MTRAYIKIDPALPDRKDYYPDGPFRALVMAFCFAAHQPVPGTFKNERLLKVLLGRHARHLTFLVDERDLVRNRDGSVSIVGWKEWQEGAYPSVSARVQAIEKRRRPMTPAERAFVYRMRKKERDEAEALALKSRQNSGGLPPESGKNSASTPSNPVVTRRVRHKPESQLTTNSDEPMRDAKRDGITNGARKGPPSVTRSVTRDAALSSNVTETLHNVTRRRPARHAEAADEETPTGALGLVAAR